MSDEYTEVEQKAMEDGWIPPDRFDAEDQGKEFISAEKFLENGSFFKKINAQSDRIKELEGAVSGLTDHYEKSTKAQLKKAKEDYDNRIASLEAEKIQALDDGEHARVVEIDKELRNEAPPVEENNEFKTMLNKFKADNSSWYESDEEMTRYADLIGDGYAPRATSNKDLFKKVEEEVKARFPDKFENPNRKNAQSVEGDVLKKPSGKTITEKDLTADELTVYGKFKHTLKTPEAKATYLKSVIEMR